jgi:hypothetical protein
VCLATSLLRSRGVGSGPLTVIPDELYERLGISREKAEEVILRIQQAESALRELAAQFNHPPHA